jgi:hypothetical protein
MNMGLTVADLARDPREVAEALPEWKRGDADEAVAATLQLAARQLHGRSPVVWVWAGHTPDDCPAWVLPVLADQARDFAPRAPARMLIEMLQAAVDAGALADAVSLLNWRGLVLLTLPDLDEELVPLALTDALVGAGSVTIATLPDAVAPDGDDIPLIGPPARLDADDPLTALATATWSHPVRVALTLGAHGQSMDAPVYPAEIVSELRRWGLDGTPPPPGARSLAVEDDPCPRRRHARTVLRRLLRMGKVGGQYHTEFDHLYRGAAPENRHDALQIGEAMVRAGLLGEKPNVGQRHVYLRREALPAIHALIDRGETRDPVLAAEWTAPGPGEA